MFNKNKNSHVILIIFLITILISGIAFSYTISNFIKDMATNVSNSMNATMNPKVPDSGKTASESFSVPTNSKKVVIGTTGFNSKQNNLIKNYSKKIAIFKSGNMSLGINLLEYVVSIFSKKIPSNYQIGICDDHHKRKVDYPSGTALMLANAVSKGKNKNLESIKGKMFLNKSGSLQKNKINFFISRRGSTIGKHSVNFNNKIENIELKHTAFSRDLFADGALNAAVWISKKNKGLFNMQDMLGLK
jgi:4-hydroxy-tetrahydrodipicolinate reductase